MKTIVQFLLVGFLLFGFNSFGQYVQVGSKLVGTGWIDNSYQGFSVSLSGDGNTLAVGGPADNQNIGAVWIYTNTGGNWSQVGGKLDGYHGYYGQGHSVSLSGDGKTLAVGAPGFRKSVYNYQTIDGAVRVYTFSGSNFLQMGGLSTKLQGNDADSKTGSIGSKQGWAVSISTDGKTIAYSGTGDNSYTGAVWVFTLSGSNWVQMGSKLVNSNLNNQGFSICLSGNGKTLAVGVPKNANNYLGEGLVNVYTLSGSNWSFMTNLSAPSSNYNFLLGNNSDVAQGYSVSLSGDGTILAMSGNGDSSKVGAVWVYTLSGSNWIQMGNKLVGTKSANSVNYGVYQGSSVSLSLDG